MANPVELWISTFNEGKLREFKELFKDQPVEVFSASELRHYSSPPETGDSFYANADIKARALKALKPQTWVLADDSGLEVPGLGGLPGIHSSRYAGEKAQASENNAKLLKMIPSFKIKKSHRAQAFQDFKEYFISKINAH